jgi:acetyl esterase
MSTKISKKKKPRRLRILFWIVGSSILVSVIIYLSFQLSPWPSALLIRYQFEKNALATSKALEKYVPTGIDATLNQQYRPNDPDAFLDAYYPGSVNGTEKVLPTVVWVHGGAWISGDKEQIANYLKILASHGYTTVSVGYSIAPEYRFPKPLVQLNAALFYLQQNAKRLHIDQTKIILAGDSAGAQIVAQEATVITNPEYAYLMGVSPSLNKEKLKGIVLACGAYDLSLVDLHGPYTNFLQTVLWSYSGKKDFLSDPRFQMLSIINDVNKDYPPAFVTAGNADPLESQSQAFASKLVSKDIRVDTLFYSADHEPKLAHEYQFDLDTTDGKNALSQIIKFLSEID